MPNDEWPAHVTREAAEAIGQWLEERGGRTRPIAALSLRERGAMATTAISRRLVQVFPRRRPWGRSVVLASERIRNRPEESADLRELLIPWDFVLSAAGRIGGLVMSTNSGRTASPAIGSVQCAVLTLGRRWQGGTTE